MLISLGMLALFLDLEHKPYVWRMYTTFQVSSPMSWGGWILLGVYPVLALAAVAGLPGKVTDAWAPLGALAKRLRSSGVRNNAGLAHIVLGAGLGIYTGILLSSLGARPLWASAVLGPLFLVSGLSTGAAFAHMIARDPGEQSMLVRSDNLFLMIELALILLFLVGLNSAGAAQAQAASLLLGGPFTAVFWVLVVGLGIVLPLAIQSLRIAGRIEHAPVAPLLVMGGGLALRLVIVAAGQLSFWP